MNGRGGDRPSAALPSRPSRPVAWGINTQGLIRDEQQIADMNAIAANQQMVEKLGPQAIAAGAKLVADASAQQQSIVR